MLLSRVVHVPTALGFTFLTLKGFALKVEARRETGEQWWGHLQGEWVRERRDGKVWGAGWHKEDRVQKKRDGKRKASAPSLYDKIGNVYTRQKALLRNRNNHDDDLKNTGIYLALSLLFLLFSLQSSSLAPNVKFWFCFMKANFLHPGLFCIVILDIPENFLTHKHMSVYA